jgi:hypothetical protein
MTNCSPCDIPQLQGTLYLSNNEEQEAHKAPSPRHDSLIWDANVLNEMSGKFEPVEPSRLLTPMPSIKNTTPVAYKATGQSTSLQERGHKPQPTSLHHSSTPDDSPKLLGHRSNDVDNPYIVSETSQVANNDLPHLNRRSCTVVKHHCNDSINALRDSPKVSRALYGLCTPCIYCTRDIQSLKLCYAQFIVTMQYNTEAILVLCQV